MGINVLSLFDGQSCGRQALKELGIEVDNYFASEIDENAITISKHNHDDIIQLGDVENYKDWELPKIDLLIGGSPCFEAGNKVLTKNGYKNIEDIVVGDMVLTHTGKYQKVLNIGSKISDTIALKSQGMLETRVTLNHPYYAVKNIEDDPTWIKVEDLEKGDYICYNKLGVEENPYNLDEEDCWLLGRYVADGHYRRDKRKNRVNSYFYQVIYSIGDNKVEDFKKHVTKRHFSCYKHTESVHRIVFSSMDMVNFLIEHDFGVGAENKNIPNFILNLPKELATSFLDGYISGDGNLKTGTNMYEMTTVSEKLALGLELLISKCYGIGACIYKHVPKSTTVIEGRVVNQKTTYQVTFRKNGNLKSIVKNDKVWNKVKYKKDLLKNRIVYNLEVENDNSYTVNNFIVHNCQGFSRNGKMLNFDDPRSKLFFKYVEILEDLRKKNPNIKFMLENVEMKKEWVEVISNYLGVNAVLINSKLLSAQNRPRLYWTNICELKPPNDKGVILKDILDLNTDTSNFIEKDGILLDSSFSEKEINLISVVNNEVRIKQATKQGYIIAEGGDGVNLQFPTSKTRRGRVVKQKSSTLDCQCNVCVYYDGIIRRLNINELERLQTLPDGYTKCVNERLAKKAIGNGWTVEVIKYILSFLNKGDED